MAEKIFRIEALRVEYGTSAGRVDHYAWEEMEKCGDTLDDGVRETGHFYGGTSNEIEDYSGMISSEIDRNDSCVILFKKNVTKHSREMFMRELAQGLRRKRGLDSAQ